MMLHKLVAELQNSHYESSIITLIDGGEIADRIRELGISVRSCNMQPGKFSWKNFRELSQLIKLEQPDLVQTWLYHADLMGGLATKLLTSRKLPVVWNIRHSNLQQEIDKKSTAMTVKLSARLSHYLPRKIIVNSETGAESHARLGYRAEVLQVIPNGFSLTTFRPDHKDRHTVLEELDLPDSVLLIGHVGRYHAQKDHRSFIKAAADIAATSTRYHFVLIGRDVETDNQELRNLIEATGFAHRFHLLGPRNDLPRWNAAFDLLISSSACGEGFSNVLGEAMASGTACVATDVGDARQILGDTGMIVPPSDPKALTKAALTILELPDLQRWQQGLAARKRIRDLYSMEAIAQQYTKLWDEVLENTPVKSVLPQFWKRAA